MRFAPDMCIARDIPCGAMRDLYRSCRLQAIYRVVGSNISNLRQQIYRIGKANISIRGTATMTDDRNQLREESIEFAISVSDVCDEITGCTVYVNQLLRCSSSIGANIHEARYAQSRADFISKLEIALKESSETDYWLELLYRKKKLSVECYSSLKNRCGTIRRKLIASITTAKSNGNKPK